MGSDSGFNSVILIIPFGVDSRSAQNSTSCQYFSEAGLSVIGTGSASNPVATGRDSLGFSVKKVAITENSAFRRPRVNFKSIIEYPTVGKVSRETTFMGGELGLPVEFTGPYWMATPFVED